MCDIQGCDEKAVYLDIDDNKLCYDCMINDQSYYDRNIIDYELITDVEKAIKESSTPTVHTQKMNPSGIEQASIIPSNETDLTVFVEDMTPEKLEIIKTEIETLPAVVNNQTYQKTFDMHQVVKSIRRLTKKSVIAKIKEWKTEFDNKKIILNSDHEKMLKVLGPMEADLDEKRKWWDMLLDAYKENAARDLAKQQKEEWFRIHLIGLHTSALIDNDQFDIDKQQEKEAAELEAANDALEQERLDLEREKFEFECIKNRLNFNDAWEEAHDSQNLDSVIKNYSGKGGFKSEETCHYNGFEPEKKPVKEYGPGPGGSCVSSETDNVDSVIICQNPEQDYIDDGHDQQTLDLIKSNIEQIIGGFKSYVFSDPKKQQKLKNFITSTEINFNTFKKAVNNE